MKAKIASVIRKHGFTLIELLVVMAIMGVLAAGVFIAINPLKRINQANDAKIQSDLGQLAQALQVNYTLRGGIYPLDLASLEAGGDIKKVPLPPGGGSYQYVINLGRDSVSVYYPVQDGIGVWCWSSQTNQLVKVIGVGCDPVGQAIVPSATPTNTPTPSNTPTPTLTPTPTINPRFGSAGFVGPSLLDVYYYEWHNISYSITQGSSLPDQPAAYPNHKFAWMVGKPDNYTGSLSCDGSSTPCTRAVIDNIYNAEEPKIQIILSKSINRGGVWIVGNEGNLSPNGPYIDPNLYGYQFKKYYNLIKSIDSTAKFAHTGLLYFDGSITNATSYLDTVLSYLASNGGIKPDIYNVHFYPGGQDQADFDRNVQQARAFKDYINTKDPGKPIWVTEFGMIPNSSAYNAKKYMHTMLTYLTGESQYQRWFWFVSYDSGVPEWSSTALSRDNLLTDVGDYYKTWLINGSQPPPPTPTLAPVVNILANPGFENQLNRWNCDKATAGSCIADSSIKHLGSYSAKVTNTGWDTGHGPGWWGAQVSQSSIAASIGEQFCLSAWVKKQYADDLVSIALQEGDPWQNDVEVNALNNTDWQFVRGTMTVGSGWRMPVQVFFRIWYNWYGGDTVWFDDISLSRGPC